MNIIVRQVKGEDLSSLLILMKEYIVDFYQRPEPTEQSLQNLVNYMLENPTAGIQFVAEADGEVIGFATLYFTFSTLQVKRAAILNDLFVAEKGRGKKIGERLFEACLEYTRSHDLAYMSWETAHDNVIAQRLYDKMGGKKSEWMSYSIS